MLTVRGLTIAILLASTATAAYGWIPSKSRQSPPPGAILPRCSSSGKVLLHLADEAVNDATVNGDSTNGIPNYMLRFEGSVKRLAESPDSSTEVGDDGVLYDVDRQFSIVTTDVIEMVQEQGGEAAEVEYLEENLLVDGLLFDDFRAEDRFRIVGSDGDGDDDGVVLEVIEARQSSTLDLAQLDDDAERQRIVSILGLAPGLCGWNARVIEAGRVQTGYKIKKDA